MFFFFLASVILFAIIIKHNIRRSKKIDSKNEQSFWAREAASNNVRKQPLDDLEYVDFSPEEFYPLVLLGSELSPQFLSDYPEAREILPRLITLSEKKIVNLSGVTNTDLKLKYGVANLATLTEYDGNYSELITLLQKYAVLLSQAGHTAPALKVLEYAVSIGSDIRATYELCANLYEQTRQREKIENLKKEAENIPTSRKGAILAFLNTPNDSSVS